MVLAACSGISQFPDEAFPAFARPDGEYTVYQDAAEAGSVVVNTYIQATRNMQNLFTHENSVYTQVLDILLRVPSNWGTGNYETNWFRFDVQYQGPLAYADEFAYRLYREEHLNQVDGMRAHNYPYDFLLYGISHIQFYEYDWYVSPGQVNRSQVLYSEARTRLEFYPDHYISSTIGEIRALRTGSRELSIMVTNFLGNPNEQPRAIREQLTTYLAQHPNNAIATFSLMNSGAPFYILAFGPTAEVAQFTQWLDRDLTALGTGFYFGFYTLGSLIGEVSTNQDVTTSIGRTYSGSRLAFDGDVPRQNREHFSNLGARLLYTVFDRFIEDNMAHFSFDVELDFVNIPVNRLYMINIEHNIQLKVQGPEGLTSIDEADAFITVSHPTRHELTGNTISVDITVDMDVFEHEANPPLQAVLILELNAKLIPSIPAGSAGFPHDSLMEVLNQFEIDVTELGIPAQAAEVFVHFMYR